MNRHKSNRAIVFVIDILAMTASFLLAFAIRSLALHEIFGVTYGLQVYLRFYVYAVLAYIFVFIVFRNPRLENQSVKDIFIKIIECHIFFIGIYMILFFITHRTEEVSRIYVGLFFIFNIVLDSMGSLIYRAYLFGHKGIQEEDDSHDSKSGINQNNDEIQHVYCIGGKSLGFYGGFESFLLNLLREHKDNKKIQYHVTCKANGDGCMDITKVPGAVSINSEEFSYCNAHCVLMRIPEMLGPAQAIYYDIHALKWACEHIEKNHVEHPIVYILASRIGPFEKKYVDRIHRAGGLVYQNPDGHENWRAKWSAPVRKYWKFSEELAVKNADLVICDSKSIEKYIQDEYSSYQPRTTYIAYGSYIKSSPLSDEDPKYVSWLASHNLRDRDFYTVVGRFVPENNYETIIREFMSSNSKKDLAIITTRNEKLYREIEQRVHFKQDKRIKFVGSVYDRELLTKIRENSYGYIHGHSVGGTNPSLLEALAATKISLLYDVGFNREVAENSALYWSKEEGSLAKLIDSADKMAEGEVAELAKNARKRIEDEYSWKYIADRYEKVFCERTANP